MASPQAAPIKIVGVLRSCFREKFGTPRQPLLVPGATATLTIKRQFLPEHSLVGLDRFSHVWLISYFHLNTNKKFLPKVHPPRLRGQTIGMFASRSPHRPTPLGLSLARLVKVSGATLHLTGIDLVDGTPILDVKPYIPEWDSVPGASPGWTKDATFPTLQVRFSASAGGDIASAERRLGRGDLRQFLSDILRQDPRNPRDKSQCVDGLELSFFLPETCSARRRFWTRAWPARRSKRGTVARCFCWCPRIGFANCIARMPNFTTGWTLFSPLANRRRR